MHLPEFLTNLELPIPDPLGLGQDAVDFIQRLTLKGGKPFLLHPIQERIVRYTFGHVDEDGQRVIDTLFLYVPSGQAKSTLAAAIMLLLLSHPKFRIPEGQLAIAALTKNQARETAFGMVVDFIKREFQRPQYQHEHKPLESRFKIVDNQVEGSITHLASGSKLSIMTREGDSQEGLSVFAFLAEEIHVWRNDRLWEAVRKSKPKVTEATTLTIVATTAGEGLGFGHSLYQQAKAIASGKVKNPYWLPVLYEADPDDDWRSEAVWRKCNFALGNFKSLQALRVEALDAEYSPTKRRKFQRYHLNRWIEGAGEPWLDLGTYDEGGVPFQVDDIRSLPCYLGVDISSTSDLTAVVAVFFDADSRTFYAVPHFWVPAASIARRSEEDNVPYSEWAEQGFVTPTSGNSIDEDAVEGKIRELCEEYDVQRVGFDPWSARRMMSRLVDDGLPAIEIAQSYRNMSPAMKGTEKAILDGRFVHGGHPVLRWCFANVPVPKPDPNDNIKPSKSGARSLKIDGAVATMMALFLATVADEKGYLDASAIVGNPPNG